MPEWYWLPLRASCIHGKRQNQIDADDGCSLEILKSSTSLSSRLMLCRVNFDAQTAETPEVVKHAKFVFAPAPPSKTGFSLPKLMLLFPSLS